MSHNALLGSGVSAQLKNNFEHVIERNKINHAWQLNQSINQSINYGITYVGPPPKPDLLLYELIPWISIIRTYRNEFILILKHFKKNRKCENGLPKRKWQPILLKEMRFLGPKNSKIERLKNWNYLRIENLKKIKLFGNWNLGSYF